MSDACLHIAPGQPAPHIAHDVAGSDLRVCPECYVFARRGRQDVRDLLNLHGVICSDSTE